MNPMALMGMLGGAGQALGGLAGLFGIGRKNPEKEANQYLNQIPGAMSPYYQPYMDAGRNALTNLQGQYGMLTDNPGEIYNKLAQGYKQSPGYDFALKQALGAAGNASAAGGMAGTPQDQRTQMETAQGLASQDFENYLNHMMGLYGTGLQGQQGIENQGYGASSDYANMLGSVLGQQAQNAYNSAQGQNMARGQDWSNIFGGLSGMGSGYFGGNYLDQLFKNMMR